MYNSVMVTSEPDRLADQLADRFADHFAKQLIDSANQFADSLHEKCGAILGI